MELIFPEECESGDTVENLSASSDEDDMRPYSRGRPRESSGLDLFEDPITVSDEKRGKT